MTSRCLPTTLNRGTGKHRDVTAEDPRSDITVFADDTEQGHRIEMNEPLRRDGVIMFQASYGPPDAGPGDRMYSVFQVVENPSDQWPLISCIVIGIGLMWHFGAMQLRYIRRIQRVPNKPDTANVEASA